MHTVRYFSFCFNINIFAAYSGKRDLFEFVTTIPDVGKEEFSQVLTKGIHVMLPVCVNITSPYKLFSQSLLFDMPTKKQFDDWTAGQFVPGESSKRKRSESKDRDEHISGSQPVSKQSRTDPDPVMPTKYDVVTPPDVVSQVWSTNVHLHK